MEKQKLIRIFDKQATQYEKKRENPEQHRWRQHLLSHAKGEVLELAVGAGANFPFYPPAIKVTATDFSDTMLEKAKRAAKQYHIDGEFLCSDIEEMNFSDQSFDTIVSTLSFCSYDNPSMVLDKINRWCRPDGQILLMEHGISSNLAFSTVQKVLNPLLYRAYGCHHTRNIMELIRESGLKINKVESYWLNTVHLIWANPR
ncbi:class I SAM-dependent methyltransferase [Paenibacillus crassostreae]|uniref:Methyltransferase type 11 n=1 Tax=Paenibacillus crassostreae TaxID=1763538 RepID=A0A167DP99_9BACL|nr:class I SAM-dependent methyltransferase [Paenibacillus crassostreae]AOZ91222.1 methyltransferase type 11 [Paenibacillus crassostreae]OAB74620.1 methyltransferase type 11 [Paenibacillus crassostreae]